MPKKTTTAQTKICFPRRKARQATVSKCIEPLDFHDKTDALADCIREKAKSPLKRNLKESRCKSSADDENCVVSKSPRKALGFHTFTSSRQPLSPVKSFAINESNITTQDAVSARRKLSLAQVQSEEYNRLRQALHASIPDHLVSRQREMGIIKQFFEDHISHSTPGSIYISGAPGTGKTACLSKVLEEVMEAHGSKRVSPVFVNCMSLKFSKNIYNRLACILTKAEQSHTDKEALKILERKFTNKGPLVVLVLDEIDQLEHEEILYKLFEMPFSGKSRLLLVGIANALDLTDRILPRLQTKESCQPTLLQFTPYSKDDIVAILQDRIKESFSDIVDQSAIQFCARKVSAMSGDARKALDIMRRAVEIAENCRRRQSISSCRGIQDGSREGTQSKVTLAQIASVCADVYGSRLSSSDGEATIPLQQKIVVCTSFVLQKDKKNKDVTSGKLYDAYRRICTSRQISSVSYEEFVGLTTLLESRGILSVKKSKQLRASTISLRLQESELDHALQDKTLLSSIIATGVPVD